ncbi:response regulator transcription factor [Uliginosibacterium sp. H3]|uniref:Response regulator transcription factor n=1 Tax=Uliginosibacterium silvisoli TaxID=3114758 RepID=A0ABU6JYA5_9RHOO|nr:response regulator transcription factor [Uliginosibacterium sp. H3]
MMATLSGSALVVEDHPLYRDALMQLARTLFGDDGAIAANSAEEGLRRAANCPDLCVVLLDQGLPGINGTEAINTFRQKFPEVAVIVVSASEDRREAMSALHAGARAFVSKAVSTEVLASAIQRVLSGEMVTAEWITPTASEAASAPSAALLTPRQSEILTLLARGHSNKEICLRLDLAEATVKMHVSSIFRTLGVANRTQAVLMGRQLGLISGTDA